MQCPEGKDTVWQRPAPKRAACSQLLPLPPSEDTSARAGTPAPSDGYADTTAVVQELLSVIAAAERALEALGYEEDVSDAASHVGEMALADSDELQ